MTYILNNIQGSVGIITFNRPEVLNALNHDLMGKLNQALEDFGDNPTVGAILLTGSPRAFAAGVDISTMRSKTYPEAIQEDFITHHWEGIARSKKPVIAVVQGYALGGGFELALMCDILIAGESAQFGLPEITIGTLPGIGGTQRLARIVGKSKAMEMCLTGSRMSAQEALQWGIASQVHPDETVLETALQLAQKIAGFSAPVVRMIRESIHSSFETPLQEGLRLERKLFHSTFALEDQKEGMAAFLEKRPPNFKNQ